MTWATSFLALRGTGGDGILMGARASTPYAGWIQAGYTNNIGTSHHYPLSLQPHGANVGIGTVTPVAPLHVATEGTDGHAFGGKNMSLTTSYHTGAQLAIVLGNHQGCYVKVFVTGDWSNHSAIAFLGEYFIRNGAAGYGQPGMIIREVDDTYGDDSISSQIVDEPSTDTFQIQFKLNASSGTSSGKLTYQVMGQFDTLT